jgi:uncharacterized protein (TIRG00374 family)
MKRALWLIGGLAIGATLLWYSLRSVSIFEVIELIKGAHPLYALLAVVFSLVFIVVKTQRWALLLNRPSALGFAALHAPVYAGSAANLVISHSGELLRARMLSRDHGLPATTTLGSIGLERLLDMLAMLILLGFLFVAGGGRLMPALAGAVQVAGALTLLAASGVLCIVLWPEYWMKVIDRVAQRVAPRYREWINGHYRGLVNGLESVKSAHRVLLVVLLSLLQWAMIAAGIWCCMKALDVSAGPIAAVAVLVLLVVGLTLPTAPAYVGTTQVCFTVVLAVFGVDEDLAFAASALYTACVVLPVFFIGVAVMLRYFGSNRLGGDAAPICEPGQKVLHP